jgi:cell division protein FtsB
MLLWLIPVSLVVVLQFALWFSTGGLLSIFALHSKQRAINNTISVLQAKNANLSADISDLRHGKDILELNARNQLGMIKGDEVFYRIVQKQIRS